MSFIGALGEKMPLVGTTRLFLTASGATLAAPTADLLTSRCACAEAVPAGPSLHRVCGARSRASRAVQGPSTVVVAVAGIVIRLSTGSLGGRSASDALPSALQTRCSNGDEEKGTS